MENILNFLPTRGGVSPCSAEWGGGRPPPDPSPPPVRMAFDDIHSLNALMTEEYHRYMTHRKRAFYYDY